jgi:isocitrate dehydrogenase (NAD+)
VKAYRVVELLGDGIGAELREAVRVLAEAFPFELRFEPVDLSVEARSEARYDEAIGLIEERRLALKYPTATVAESPNQVLRTRLGLSVIHRPVKTIPGVKTLFTGSLDLDIVRVATGGTYADPGRLVGRDAAVALRIVEAEPSREAARFAFDLARRLGKKVTSSSKYTIQRFTDGLFERVVDDIDALYSDVSLERELFDALLAKIVMRPESFGVVLVLNEYGDFLSDMACGLIGSLGLGASGNYSYEGDGLNVALFDAAHGTAPDIAGRGLANPTAIFLALELMLSHLGESAAAEALKGSIFEMLESGVTTGDLGGALTTLEFTRELVDRVKSRLS